MNKFAVTMRYAEIIRIKERVSDIASKIEFMPKLTFVSQVDEILDEFSKFLETFDPEGFDGRIGCGKDILDEVKAYYIKTTAKKKDFTEQHRTNLVLQVNRLVNYMDAFDEAFRTAYKYKL